MRFTKQLGYLKFRMDFRNQISKADKKTLDIMREELTEEYNRRRKKGEL